MSLLNSTQITPGHYVLTGELTFASLSQCYKHLQLQWPKQGAWQLDCEKISHIDSAGVAFLLDCIRYSEQTKLLLRIINLPTLAMSLMQAQGVVKLIIPYLESKNHESIN